MDNRLLKLDNCIIFGVCPCEPTHCMANADVKLSLHANAALSARLMQMLSSLCMLMHS